MTQLAHKAAQGFALTLMQNVATRGIAFLAQMLLAKLLDPADFGKVGLVLTVNALVQPLMQFGIEDVLMSRRKSFDLWAVPAYGLSLSLSALAALMLLVVGIVAWLAFDDLEMMGMLCLLSASTILYGCSVLPDAKLRSDMRFEITCTYALAEMLGVQSATLLLAWCGFGAASFILPIPIASAIRAIVFFSLAPISLDGAFRWRRWGHLLRRGALVFGQRSTQLIREQGDYVLLGLLSDKTTLGFYYMSYRLAAQPVYMLVRSLSTVLFPVLAKLADQPGLQVQAVVQASFVLSLIITPVSFLLSVLAEPIVRLLFDPRWLPVAPYISVLSVGLAFDILPAIAWSLSTARGMFRFQFASGIVATSSFLVCICGGFVIAGGVGIAFGVALNFILSSIFYPLYLFHPLPDRFSTLMRLWLGPAILSATAMESGRLLVRTWLPDEALTQIVLTQIVLTALVGGAIYVGLLRLFMRELLRDVFAQLSGVASSFSRHRRQPA